MSEGRVWLWGWARSATAVLVPCVLTAVAFVGLYRFGLVGSWPLWLLLMVLAAAGVLGELTGLSPNATAMRLHVAIATQILAVTVVMYAIGWGPMLAIGYIFVLAHLLEDGGSRVWRPTLLWAIVGIGLGQWAIMVGLVPTYVSVGYAHGLAVLGVLGLAFVMRLLGRKTEQNEQAACEVRSTVSVLSATLDATADGILVVDTKGAISHYNAQFADMWQLPKDVLDGRDGSFALEFVLDQLVHPDLFVARVEELYADPDGRTDDTLLFKDGRVFERHSCPYLIDGAIAGRVWSFRDITDRQRLIDELAHQAFHDHLTGLANRALLRDRLEHALARSRRSAATVAVLFCDLDRFKMINDTLGHETGDRLLVEVAARFEHSVRDGDTVARLGGDEFSIVLDETNPRDAVVVARRLLDSLREPFVVDNKEVFIRASVGIAANDHDALDCEELLCRADIAMYAAKSRGRDRIEVFEPVMQHELAARQELQSDLRSALVRGELSLHYQPLVNLSSDRIESVEALLRWQHPVRGAIPPDQFIPIAEENGLIIELGRYVLNEACAQTSEWRMTLPEADNLSVSVNVSSVQLYDDAFVGEVRAALERSRLPPASLTIELTESTLLTDTATVHQRLEALKRLGVQLAIDDFGTGYSSLAYLRSFPVDYLKIDRSFINDLCQGERENNFMVRSIINIGHNLNLGIIAEGIEQQAQLDEVRDAGCDSGQGFLFARPAPPHQIPEIFSRSHRRHPPVAP